MGAPLNFSLHLDLTVAGQDMLALPRLYPGDAVTWRFQVTDEQGAPIDLTGYVITLTARRRRTDADAVLVRSSTVNIVTGTRQIAIDADQDVEDTAAYTGRGWFEVRFLATAPEEAALLAAAGVAVFDIVIKAPGGAATTFAEGALEVPRRMTRA